MFEGLVNSCSIVYGDDTKDIMKDIFSQIHKDGHGYVLTDMNTFSYYETEFPYAIVTGSYDQNELINYGNDDNIKYIIFDYNGNIEGYNTIIKNMTSFNKTCIIVQNKLYMYNKHINDKISNLVLHSSNINYSRIYNNYLNLKFRYSFDEFVNICDKNFVVIDRSNINIKHDKMEISKLDHNIVYQSVIIGGESNLEEISLNEKIEQNTSKCIIL